MMTVAFSTWWRNGSARSVWRSTCLRYSAITRKDDRFVGIYHLLGVQSSIVQLHLIDAAFECPKVELAMPTDLQLGSLIGNRGGIRPTGDQLAVAE